MDKLSILGRLSELYKQNINIINYLNEIDKKEHNSVEDIMISYDFQAGSYVEHYFKNKEFIDAYTGKLADIINELDCSKESIFECGVGEATTLVPLVNKLENKFSFIGGNDISWSRIAVAQKFAKENCKAQVGLVVGNLFELPLADNSIDIVYTSHSLEPNGGHEEELLKELYRVTKNYLILLEPAYELAEEAARERMKQHGYVTGLYNTAIALGYKVDRYELFGISSNPLNPTGLMIIGKSVDVDNSNMARYCCPVSKTKLEVKGNVYFSLGALLAYPIMNGVPCLTRESAVVATKMEQL